MSMSSSRPTINRSLGGELSVVLSSQLYSYHSNFIFQSGTALGVRPADTFPEGCTEPAGSTDVKLSDMLSDSTITIPIRCQNELAKLEYSPLYDKLLAVPSTEQQQHFRSVTYSVRALNRLQSRVRSTSIFQSFFVR